ncbi:uncharacterized protein LOC100830892 [Brachypodium distachyon]|uniref:uncharacterized protein LOC100830892 n=1 Tax=Brachypodium distachyon TaxID=15368 RepID=UPI0001C6FE51|nr:uncharacterized protein LOC100830892 [Brachypodium distachyon]|eukprot:XP_010240199.1 uncharacterized protein LOC100830892 [Brachypodium distachyon]
MQPPCLGACGGSLAVLGPGRRRPSSVSRATVSCAAGGGRASSRGKENVWSVDNDRAAAHKDRSQKNRRRRRPGGRRLPPPLPGRRKENDAGSRVLVSGAMLVDVETVLQTQEPVIMPSWDTFASSLSGIWKGVGAVFSPITAEMEPVGLGSKEEYLYDCYTLSQIEKMDDDVHGSVIQRKTNWVQLNPHGEAEKQSAGHYGWNHDSSSEKVTVDLPAHESFDLKKSEVLDEDTITMEPGIVFFEDGSYSRGPLDIAIGEYDESKYFLSPTYKFEQCLVKGCHKRLRIVHTIEFNEGGANIQIVRVAMYEEQWTSPANIHVEDDAPVDVRPFSQRKRTKPSELTGSWKVYEVSATPIYSEEIQELEGGAPFVYLCMETMKKRTLPESSVFFGEEEMLDMQDVTVLWLPGGVTAYVDVDKDGILCIGVSWYSDEGINLVMERDYGTDGKLREVRTKTEVKRRWNQPVPP